MEKPNILSDLKMNPKFFVISLILNGLTGFIMLSYVFQRNILKLLVDNGFILLIFCLIELLWIGYAIYKSCFKKEILLKDFKYILLVIPIFAISFMGQLGNSQAFEFLFGKIGSEIYNTYIIGIHIYTLYLLIKKK